MSLLLHDPVLNESGAAGVCCLKTRAVWKRTSQDWSQIFLGMMSSETLTHADSWSRLKTVTEYKNDKCLLLALLQWKHTLNQS